VGAGTIFVFGGKRLSIMREDLFSLRDKLRLDTAPDFAVLSAALYIFAAIQLLTAAGLTALLCLNLLIR
jgi:hypothetical protein